jgi:Flp pilus assembly protein TadD
MRRAVRRRLLLPLVLAALLAVAALAWWVQEAGQGASGSARAPLAYVGGKACVECHADEERRWRGSHHDLAMQEASTATVLGDFGDARFTRDGVTSRFFRKDGTYVVRTDGPDGRLHEYRIGYVFGVAPLQQYLVPFPDGRYQALGIAWDARARRTGGQRWFHLYPNEEVDHRDVLHWTKPSQNWNSRCAECHSTNLRKGFLWPEGRFHTTFSDVDVSCEACHGPGARHVAWAERVAARGVTARVEPGLVASFTERRSRTWEMDEERGIAKPSKVLETRDEVETCARCHARRGLLSEDDQPGQLLAQTHRPALLDDGLYYPDGQMHDEVYEWGSFLQSRMYAAGVTCSDCHDPHGLKVRAAPDALCASCHLPERFASRRHHFHREAGKGASCVACHMRTETYMVVDPRHDHSFRVPRPDLTISLGSPNACNDCHRDRSARWTDQAIRRWYPKGREGTWHYGEALQAGRTFRPGAEEALVRVASDPKLPGIVRGTAVSLLPAYLSPLSRPTLEGAVADKEPLVRLGAATALDALEPRERVKVGASLLSDPVRAVRLEAVVPLADVPAELMTAGQRIAFDRALDDFFQAQRVNAEEPESHLNLGIVFARRGQLADARRAYDTALRLGPWFVPAYANLADLLRMEGKDEEGERVLRAGLRVDPGSAALHHALGLLLVRQKRMYGALAELERAADLAPGNPGFAYAYAIGLRGAGQTDAALGALRRAQGRSPGARILLEALVTINRDRGALLEARAWADMLAAAAPGDPAARRLVAELEDAEATKPGVP